MEVLGSQRTVNPYGQVVGSEFAQIVVGSRVTLGQQCNVQWQRPLRAIVAIGDPHAYFAPGQGQGSISLGRLMGAEGMLSLLSAGSAGDCGTINALQISAGGGRCLIAPTKTLNFGGAMFEGIALGITTQPEIVENYNIRISSLEKV